MLGMFCGTRCSSNEEYKKELKKRRILFGIIFLIGCLALFLSLASHYLSISLSPEMIGFYGGSGVSMIVVSIILVFKNFKLLHHEGKLKSARIKASDERNQALSLSATRASIFILLLAMLLIVFIGGLWNPILSMVLANLLILFFVSYCVAYFIYSKRN